MACMHYRGLREAKRTSNKKIRPNRALAMAATNNLQKDADLIAEAEMKQRG